MKDNENDGILKALMLVKNDRGIHTRPATEIVKFAVRHKADIRLVYQKKEVNAKSLLGILMLAATKGSRIVVKVKGPDAQQALEGLLGLASKNFNIRY